MSSPARLRVLTVAGVFLVAAQLHADGLTPKRASASQRTTCRPSVPAGTSRVGSTSRTHTVAHRDVGSWSLADSARPSRNPVASADLSPQTGADGLDGSPILAQFTADANVARDPLLKPSVVSAGAVSRPGDDLLRAVGQTRGWAPRNADRLGSLPGDTSGRTAPAMVTLAVVGLGVVGLTRYRVARA